MLQGRAELHRRHGAHECRKPNLQRDTFSPVDGHGAAPHRPSRKTRYAERGITGLMPSDWLCRDGR
jgi:hypothetical protein